MGCTSSAPSTISAHVNTADKSIQIEDEATIEQSSTEVVAADIEDENRTIPNETKVLPLCDTFEQTVQLVRNNKSANSLLCEKEIAANGHIHEGKDEIYLPNQTQNEVSVTKMELLMEKVFETNHHLNVTDHNDNESDKPQVDMNDLIETGAKTEEGRVEIVIEDLENTGPESYDDKPEAEAENDLEALEVEEPSPSQSQSSRATRWEALADIAAELPPSLAVDPLTGQIYALSK